MKSQLPKNHATKNPAPNKQAPRTELMYLLDGLQPNRLIYIHAPAGYGKTVSANLWLEHMRTEKSVKGTWIPFDEYDNKPVDFCRRLTGAFRNLQPQNRVLDELINHPSFDAAPDEFAVRALDCLSDDENKYLLVLDDLHVISNAEIQKLLPILIKRLPQNFSMLLLSRQAPPDTLSELVVKNLMSVVGANALRFSKSEIKTFFSLNGHKLTKKQEDDVYASTDGWAIGVRALLLSEKSNYDIKVAGQYLEAFLKTNVWEKWDERLRNFMMKTSVVDELTPGICQALTGETSASKILDELAQGNTFLQVNENSTYKFHDLFRGFLLNVLEREGETVTNEQYNKAGDWYFDNGNFYKATLYYVKCKDYEGVARGYSAMNKYNSKNNNMDTRIAMIDFMRLESIPSHVFDKHPALYIALIVGYYLGGEAKKMTDAIDRSKKILPLIKERQPDLLKTLPFVYGLDPRISLIDQTKCMLSESIPKSSGKAMTTTLSLNLPFFHRSQNDYSEYVHCTDENLKILRYTYGAIIGSEFDLLEYCIRAGILYEQGKAERAHEAALSAVAHISAECASELQFCAMMILTQTLFSSCQKTAAYKILDDIDGMIERNKAFFLTANLQAYRYRLRLTDGDREAALEWLKLNGESTYNHLAFYKIFRHFTTARAHIAVGDYSMAILFLKKLYRLCEDYNRPLDIIESCILLAIAYWKKGRGAQTDALIYLEKAILMASRYGYTQVFANEGVELVRMLQRIQKRIVQKEYTGAISSSFTKALYIATLAESKRSRGLTGGRASTELTFTQRQITVMQLMCEGCGRKEIAERMGLKPSGAKAHLTLIYKKLDVPNGVEAVMKIKELGLLDE